MPEDDTLRKLVRLLIPELLGQTLVAGRLARRPAVNLSGRRVTNVHALGKHLSIEFASAVAARHLLVSGLPAVGMSRFAGIRVTPRHEAKNNG